jgi:hypothetical protein
VGDDVVSWKTWVTTCLAAALVGVCVGAAYTALNGRFDASKASGALPGPAEQATRRTPPVRPAPAASLDLTNSDAHKAEPGQANSTATAAKSHANKPAKAAKKAPGGGEKAGKKGKSR